MRLDAWTRRHRFSGILLLGALALPHLAAAHPRAGHRPAVRTERVGIASYYGWRHQGLRTASGARFNPMALTAASPSLPFGSRVRVTDRRTGRSVVVVINDRLPPIHHRLIDLSVAAARELGILRQGIAWVTLAPAKGA